MLSKCERWYSEFEVRDWEHLRITRHGMLDVVSTGSLTEPRIVRAKAPVEEREFVDLYGLITVWWRKRVVGLNGRFVLTIGCKDLRGSISGLGCGVCWGVDIWSQGLTLGSGALRGESFGIWDLDFRA